MLADERGVVVVQNISICVLAASIEDAEPHYTSPKSRNQNLHTAKKVQTQKNKSGKEVK